MADHVQGGRLKRFAQFAGVAARTTGDLLKAEAKRRILGSEEAALDEALQPTAARIVSVLGEMKGAAAKLGQFLSLVDQDTFPEEARKILTRLLSQTPHRMTYEQAGEVLARELGGPPEEVFAAFSEEPFAAASMGQVHAATLKDGRDVVVKIQFPGVDKSIESDLKNLSLLAKGLSLSGSLLDGRAYVKEIGDTLREETDYRAEAQRLREYRDAVRPWSGLVTPEVVDEHTTRHILTMERFHGPTMLEFAQDESRSAADRFEVGARLVEAIWGPFLRERLVHADPHPGNYIVLPGNRLGVLDFGATKRLSVPFAVAYWRIVAQALEGGRPRLVDALEGAGFTMHGDREALNRWIDVLADIVERPIRNAHYDWGACKIAVDVRDAFAANVGTALRCKAPPESIMFYRAAAGAAGDFRMLRAAGNFQGVLRELAATARREISPELRAAAPDLFAS